MGGMMQSIGQTSEEWVRQYPLVTVLGGFGLGFGLGLVLTTMLTPPRERSRFSLHDLSDSLWGYADQVKGLPHATADYISSTLGRK